MSGPWNWGHRQLRAVAWYWVLEIKPVSPARLAGAFALCGRRTSWIKHWMHGQPVGHVLSVSNTKQLRCPHPHALRQPLKTVPKKTISTMAHCSHWVQPNAARNASQSPKGTCFPSLVPLEAVLSRMSGEIWSRNKITIGLALAFPLLPMNLVSCTKDARPCSLSLTLAIRDPTTDCDWMRHTFF